MDRGGPHTSEYISVTMPQHDQQSERLKHCHEPESWTAPHSSYGEPRSLHLGRKVFLSHSGRDKGFARSLYRGLCSCYHGFEVAFLDEVTLPKGEPIDMKKSIVEEARGSSLGVLILTDDFFTLSRNPMLELEAFVAGGVDLLPLFLTMSVDEFKGEQQWNKWEKKWEEWARTDDKLVIENWRSYLKIVSMYNGLEYCKIAPGGRQDIYIDEVVKQVASIIGPVVPMSREVIYGKDRLCQMVDNMYKECTSERSLQINHRATQIASTSASLGLRKIRGLHVYNVVGIHGFPGSGKTILCKCLCDFYFGEVKGKVSYIDLGLRSESRLDRMQHVLSRLGRGSTKDIHDVQLERNQVENLLKKRLSSMKDPVFLAIDNILPESESQEEALIYLRCKFPMGSKILITSRSEHILKNLTSLLPQRGSFSAVIEYMPALNFEEARDIFEYEFPDLHDRRHSNVAWPIEDSLQSDVDACVRKCIHVISLSKCCYHPLLLKTLAAVVKWDTLTPSQNIYWRRRVGRLLKEGAVYMSWQDSLPVTVKWDTLLSSGDWKGRLAELASDGIVDTSSRKRVIKVVLRSSREYREHTFFLILVRIQAGLLGASFFMHFCKNQPAMFLCMALYGGVSLVAAILSIIMLFLANFAWL